MGEAQDRWREQNKERQQKTAKEYHQTHKEERNAYHKARYHALKEGVADVVEERPCKDCGERPRIPYQSYCKECRSKRAAVKAGPYKDMSPENQQRAGELSMVYLDRKKYGLSRVEAKALRALPCEVCGQPGPNNIDHKVSGSYRGVLCTGCNIAAGALKDDPVRARALANYLERTKL